MNNVFSKTLSAICHKLSADDGQSLIEILIALTIVSLVGLGLVKATISSVKNSSYSKEQNQTTIMAQKKIAEIINQKNQSSEAFFSSLPSPSEEIIALFCLKTSVVTASLPTNTPNFNLAKMAKINVDVYWEESDGGTVNCGGKAYASNKHYETYVTN